MMFSLKLYNSKNALGLMTQRRWKAIRAVRLSQAPARIDGASK